MTATDAETQNEPERQAPPGDEPDRDTSRSRPLALRVLCAPGTVALLTWIVVGPIAAWIPARLSLNPFLQAGADKPLVIGGLMLAVVAVLCRWTRSPVVTGVAAG